MAKIRKDIKTLVNKEIEATDEWSIFEYRLVPCYNFDVEVVAAFFRYRLYRNEMYILLVKTMYR